VASFGTQLKIKKSFLFGKKSFSRALFGTMDATHAKLKTAISQANAAPTFVKINQTPRRFAPRKKLLANQPKNTKSILKYVLIKSKLK
jgi:hypothetical protein